ncbi:MAG: hypothetical protein WAS27_02480 [Candidatus Saccharimonadales bacterium]
MDAIKFRRNRTLTGSVSPQVGSANEHNADLRSPRAHVHSLSRLRRRLGAMLGVVAGVSVLLIVLLFQFTARPAVVSADESVALDASRYTQAINTYLGRHPAERVRVMLDEARLNEYMTRVLPEVASIKALGSAGFGESQFSVAVRRPLVSWMIGTDQYFVDATGVSFTKNYYDIPDVKIIDQSGARQADGSTIASSRFLNFVGRTVSVAKDHQLEVEQAIIPPSTTRQIEIRIRGYAFPLKFSLDRSVGEQVEDARRALEYFTAQGITPEYVDVRVGGKAFYK